MENHSQPEHKTCCVQGGEKREASLKREKHLCRVDPHQGKGKSAVCVKSRPGGFPAYITGYRRPEQGTPSLLRNAGLSTRTDSNLQGAEQHEKNGTRCQSSAAISWPLKSILGADEAREGHLSPGSPGTCFMYVPLKGSGDLQQLEHNQVSENKKQGHKNAVPRQNIIA